MACRVAGSRSIKPADVVIETIQGARPNGGFQAAGFVGRSVGVDCHSAGEDVQQCVDHKICVGDDGLLAAAVH